MDLVRRIFAPEIASLQGQLKLALDDRDRFEGGCDELNSLLEKAQRDLKAEIKRNRLREDQLVGQILQLGGGRELPVRINEQQTLDLNETVISPVNERILRERAREVAEQRSGGDPVDGKTLEETYQELAKDPNYWLTDA